MNSFIPGNSEGDYPPRGDKAEHESSGEFKVEIEDPKAIYDQVKTPAPQWALGKMVLEDPFKDIGVYIQSDGKALAVTGSIYSPEILGPPIGLDEELISERLKTKKIGKSLLVLGEDDKPMYEIKLEGNAIISPTFSAGGHSSPVGPRKVGSFDSFKRELEVLAKITETVVESAYRKAGKASPDVTLTFRPPIRIGPNSFLKNGSLKDIIRERVIVEKPNIGFKDIGGQKEAKKEIQSLVFALTNPDIYRKWGTRPPKGILLAGPPGNGKTLLAKALAAQAEASFFHIEVSDIVSKWYGEAEQLMKAVFEEASRMPGKTIIFFDELDAVAPRREGSHEASARIVSTMLENIDGLEVNKDILIVAATNRPEAIDSALLRPGRFDRIVEVSLPKEEGRKEILGIHMAKAEQMAERKLFNKLEMEQILAMTKNFSGADLSEVIRRALEEKVRIEGKGNNPGLVTTRDIIRIIRNYERVREIKGKLGFV